ncbi:MULTISPECIES: VTT domain-containing protein [Kocuria]|uniref:Alkaline phosphatase n=1 Tax=Kocuria subflava TaxID=1736139 RepID=A0A846THN1_9MICC|nr:MULTISPECIES: VTT domain-containing protein [Kocuria]NKE08668.1 alkaline phosphatase [Kocuria subflava]
MDFCHQVTSAFRDPGSVLQAAGPLAIAIMTVFIFIESGLLFSFLPGDSLLFAAGMLLPSMGTPFWLVWALAAGAAIAGGQVGYMLGNKFGRGLFSDNARVLKTSHLVKAEAFFVRHGGKALVLARFVPIVRTYVPLVAGASSYRYRKFVGWNVTGALLWVTIMLTAGRLLGGIPFVAEHVDLIAITIAILSIIPIVVHVLASRKSQTQDHGVA